MGMSHKIRMVAALLGLILLAGCGEITRSTGYVPADDDLEAIVVGRDTRTTVETIIGAPSTEGILDAGGWYYVRSDYRTVAYRAPVEEERQVVAISFDEEGVVTNIERFGLEDGQVIALSRRVTDDNVKGIGFLRQLFGNLGRIDPNTFFR